MQEVVLPQPVIAGSNHGARRRRLLLPPFRHHHTDFKSHVESIDADTAFLDKREISILEKKKKTWRQDELFIYKCAMNFIKVFIG